MKTYYDGLNDFHKLNEQERLASSAQLSALVAPEQPLRQSRVRSSLRQRAGNHDEPR